MSEATRHMTLEEFLPWQDDQEVRCELIDGQPVAMTGATFAHDLVVGNLRAVLRDRLRAAGSPCRPFGADIGTIITPTTLRRPDVAVYCLPFNFDAATSNHPRLIAEVLSRSTEHVDYFVKVEDYKTIAALQVILLVSPQAVDLGLWTRSSGDWHYRQTRDIDGMI